MSAIELQDSNSSEDETPSSGTDDATMPAMGGSSAQPRVHLSRMRFRVACVALAVSEALFVSGCVFFIIANLFPLPYLILIGGVLLTASPFVCMSLCTLQRKGLRRYGQRPWEPLTTASRDLQREQMCRWLAWRVGVLLLLANLMLMSFVGYLWWAPYFETGLANIPVLCVAGLGHVATTSARFVVRCPTASKARVLVWPHDDNKGLHGAVFSDWAELLPATVSSALLVVNELKPGSSYRWVVEYESTLAPLPASGSLRTQPLVGTPEAAKFRFTFGSCLLRDSLSPFDSFAEIARQNSSFMVFLGDFIYIDQPNPEIVGPWRFAYEAKYVSNFDDPHMRALRLNMPWVHTYDDHEIRNDWDAGEESPFDVAIHDVWYNILGKGNPPSMRAPSTVNGVLRPEYHFTFRYGEACFFAADTRRHRSRNTISWNDPAKTMLGAAQLADLITWLDESNAPSARCTVKFICTSVPMTATAASHDTWSAYEHERQFILDYIDTHEITGVIFLSGDRHTAGAIQLQGSMFELSASPVDGFWSVDPSFNTPHPNETVLAEHTSRDYWGTVEVDVSGNATGRVTLHIDAQNGNRPFSRTIVIPKAH